MKKLMKLIKNEDGQAIVLVALFMVVLLGFAALVIDVGDLYLTKTQLQTAADAAALAGAQDLPDAGAENTAVNIAGKNGMKATQNGVKASGDTVTATTPYLDPKKNKYDSNKIEVVCKRTVPPIFSVFLNSKGTEVSARAVAQNSKWAEEALPFINLDGYGAEGNVLAAWNKVNPGDKERIHNDDLIVSPDNASIKVKYEDGSIMFKKGKVLSDVQDALPNILKDGNIVYLFAIRSDLVGKTPYIKLGEGQLIPIEDTVVLQCKVIGTYDKVMGNTIVSLELEKIHSYDSINKTFPVKNTHSKLVE